MKNLKSGIVALVGRPNVGKSTLLNALIAEDISIVTPKAQTTRDQVRGILNEKRGQIVFVDTPGIHRANEGGINEYMIQEVRRSLDEPDAVLYLIDPFSKVTAERVVLGFLKEVKSNLVVVINKCDLMPKHPAVFEWLPDWIEEIKTTLADTQCKFIAAIEIAAQRNKKVNEVTDCLFELLPEGPALYADEDSLTDRSLRFVVSELIRKQLFLNLGDEIPYSCAVEIEAFHENKKPVLIQAIVYVERESQKGMVIGSAGKKIKEIGTSARKEIEKLMGEKVFLELRVKVLEAWTSEMKKMKNLGYALEKQKAPKQKTAGKK